MAFFATFGTSSYLPLWFSVFQIQYLSGLFLLLLALPLSCLYESLCLKCNTSMAFFCYFCAFLLPASMNLCVSNAIPQWPFLTTFGTSSYLPLWFFVFQIQYLNGIFLLLLELPLTCLYESLCLKYNTFLLLLALPLTYLYDSLWSKYNTWVAFFLLLLAFPLTCLYESLCLKYNSSVAFFATFGTSSYLPL